MSAFDAVLERAKDSLQYLSQYSHQLARFHDGA
jgi:hypothetical protein